MCTIYIELKFVYFEAPYSIDMTFNPIKLKLRLLFLLLDLAYLNTIAEDPVKVGCEETEEEVEMNLVTKTSHLPEY